MIVYDLVCKHRHRFEGWFSSTEDFERQREAKLIRWKSSFELNQPSKPWRCLQTRS